MAKKQQPIIPSSDIIALYEAAERGDALAIARLRAMNNVVINNLDLFLRVRPEEELIPDAAAFLMWSVPVAGIDDIHLVPRVSAALRQRGFADHASTLEAYMHFAEARRALDQSPALKRHRAAKRLWACVERGQFATTSKPARPLLKGLYFFVLREAVNQLERRPSETKTQIEPEM